MQFKEIKLLLVVLMLAAVVLLSTYLFILEAPLELVPHSQKVINYFYDRRTFIGINKLVANDDKGFEGVRENWRTPQSLRQRDLWHGGADDPDSYIDDDNLPSGIDQPAEETLHSPSAPSLPPDIVEPVAQGETVADDKMIKEDLLSKSLANAVTSGPVDKDVEPQKVTVKAHSNTTPPPSSGKAPTKTIQLPAPLAPPPPQKVRMSKSLRKRRETVARSRESMARSLLKANQFQASKTVKAHRKSHVRSQRPKIANCTDNMCKQLTLDREKHYYNSCLKLAEKDYLVRPCQCRLMDAKKRGRYALVSLPGSGNTWVRGLLEKATGVCTGSMWCDPSLRANHFCMEAVRSTAVLIVKSHDIHLRWVGMPLLSEETVCNKPDFVGAVLIHRDPFSATVAEWNRDAGIILKNATENKTEKAASKSTSNQKYAAVKYITYNTAHDNHSRKTTEFKDVISAETRTSVQKLFLDQKIAPKTGKATNQHLLYFGKEMFGNNVGWNATVYLQAEKWKRMIEHFIINNRVQPVLVVRYEDLTVDPVFHVKRILKFLKYQYDEEDVEQRLQGGFSAYYRNHTDTFEHYTLEQKTYMNSVIMSVIKRLEQQRITDFIPLEHYLRP